MTTASPITDKHRQLVEQAQQRWSAIGQMSNPVEKFLAFDAFTQELEETKKQCFGDVYAFFKNAADSLSGKIIAGTVSAGIGATTLAGLVAGLAAVPVGLIALFLATAVAVVLASPDNTRTSPHNKAEAFKKTCPEMISLNNMSSEIEIARQKLFETPYFLDTVLSSREFIAVYDSAQLSEKGVLARAFRKQMEADCFSYENRIKSAGDSPPFEPL